MLAHTCLLCKPRSSLRQGSNQSLSSKTICNLYPACPKYQGRKIMTTTSPHFKKPSLLGGRDERSRIRFSSVTDSPATQKNTCHLYAFIHSFIHSFTPHLDSVQYHLCKHLNVYQRMNPSSRISFCTISSV